MSREISTKVPDDLQDLQRKRIAANRPEMDKLLADMMNKPLYETLFKACKDGLVNMTDSYKTVARLIHDIQGHRISFSVCPDELCKINNEQINAAIALIARASEFEPEPEVAIVDPKPAPDVGLVDLLREAQRYIYASLPGWTKAEDLPSVMHKLANALAAHKPEVDDAS